MLQCVTFRAPVCRPCLLKGRVGDEQEEEAGHARGKKKKKKGDDGHDKARPGVCERERTSERKREVGGGERGISLLPAPSLSSSLLLHAHAPCG